MRDPASREADRIRSYFGESSWRRSSGRDMLVDERRKLLENIVRERLPPLRELVVCDVGCGAGSDLKQWSDLGVPHSQLFGTELVAERGNAARVSVPGASVVTVEDFKLPFPDRSFDLVTASLVLSTIVHADSRRTLVAEMRRVARPTGVVAIYDFTIRKPWNHNVTSITTADLAAASGPPAKEYRLAPFLPLLDVALKLPTPLRTIAIKLLPRTHRLWVWPPA